MKKLLIEFWKKWRARRYTMVAIREAYLIKNGSFLKKVYQNKYSSTYLKRYAIYYFGEIDSQKNYDFLMKEFRTAEKETLKIYLYNAIRNMENSKQVKVPDIDIKFLNDHTYLKKEIGYNGFSMSGDTRLEPLTFRDKQANYLGHLESLKSQMSYY